MVVLFVIMHQSLHQYYNFYTVQLAKEHHKSIKQFEQVHHSHLKERQDTFQEKFDEDINYFKTHGHTHIDSMYYSIKINYDLDQVLWFPLFPQLSLLGKQTIWCPIHVFGNMTLWFQHFGKGIVWDITVYKQNSMFISNNFLGTVKGIILARSKFHDF